MSTCISRQGEFGSHILDDLHTCTRCHVLDEDALLEELRQLRAELVMLRSDEEHSNRDIERLNGEVMRAWSEVRHRDKQLEQLREQVAAVGEANIHLNARLGEAKRERDLAVAHDRQPYPTAHAYEAACRALEKHRQRADLLEAQRDQVLALCDRADDVEICQEIGAMGRVSSREIRAIFSVSRTPDRQDEGN